MNEKNIPSGRILYLMQNPVIMEYQLKGGQLENPLGDKLLDKVSTDEIIPNRACLSYTGVEVGHLGENALTGLRGGIIKPGDIVRGNFQTLVAGPSFARGSSRIHAPMALAEAGINLIIADSERIFSENCVNYGIYLLNPKSESAKKILAKQSVSSEEAMSDLSPMQKDIMRSGSLLSYFQALKEGKIKLPQTERKKRPMTAVEKIISKKSLKQDGSVGRRSVKPGDEVIAIPDQYYGYELQSGPMRKSLTEEFGENIKVKRKDKIRLYNDHTALFKHPTAILQQEEQNQFAHKLDITSYETDSIHGAPAICHTDMIEHNALPGQLILGNDSHTDTLGVLNNLAVGKGALDLAGAIAYDWMTIKVPETIRVNLSGELKPGVTMKDFMLQFGARDELKKDNIASERVLEFGGEGLENISFDEQLKLTNMAVELQAFTGIIDPNKQITSYLKDKRGLSEGDIEMMFVKSDPDAQYFATFDIDLSSIEPTVATPGDTQNGKPLSEIREQNIIVDKAYIGSCTHGTVEDLKQAADVLRGKKIKEGVKLYVQASSIDNLHEATKMGYMRDLAKAGAEILMIGCGACMNAGEGSVDEGEVGIFATNRNFPGRTGRGETYLASPAIVAASAIKGTICGPDDLN